MLGAGEIVEMALLRGGAGLGERPEVALEQGEPAGLVGLPGRAGVGIGIGQRGERAGP